MQTTHPFASMTTPRTRPVLIALMVCALLAIGLVYLQTGTFVRLNIYDEGIIVVGALRVMSGQIPYRDFWTQYSPGQLYALAGLFQIFGKAIMVERTMDIAVRALLALMIFALGARLTTPKLGALVWVLGLLWVQYYGFFGYPIFAGLLFSFASLYAYIEGMFKPSRRWLFLSGVLLGLEAVFRHDMAIYTGIAQIVVYIAFTITSRASAPGQPSRRVAQACLRLLPYFAGALVALGPMLGFLLTHVPASEMLDQLFIFPLTVFPKVRRLIYPKFDLLTSDLPFYAPFLIYALASLIALTKLYTPRTAKDGHTLDHDRSRAWGILMVALFGLFGFNQSRVRSDTIHTVQFFLSALTLFPALLAGAGFPIRAQVLTYLTRTIAVILILVSMVDPIDSYLHQLNDRDRVASSLNNTLPVARGALIGPDENFAVRAVQQLTQPGDMVYVGLSRHDRVFANDAMFYFLMERPNPTRYQELHPGLTNTAPVQREMIADLERNRVKFVVLTNMFEGASEPNDSALSTGVTLLDDYIKAHYRFQNTIGSYTILRRRDG